MVVDDQPENLKLMEEMLRNEGYEVRCFPRGRLALASASQQKPDLILLDINMPELNGFDVCALLKSDKNLRSIPVIFLSALTDTGSKIKGFKAGCVDYITKPFQYEEVQARVETHMQLARAREVERELLENTLNGTVRTLADLVHLTGPDLGARADAIRSIVIHLSSKLGLAEPWQYDLAAILCLIGCVALPVDAFERAYARAPELHDEEMFLTHPVTGSGLLANIPRLENVAEMIRRQHTAAGASLPGNSADLGACMLRITVELDRWMFTGLSFHAALDRLKTLPHDLPPRMIDALENYEPPLAAFELKLLHVHDLQVSMIAEDDIVTLDGNFMILRKGAAVSATTLERIRNFDKTRGICQPIHVMVPSAGGQRKVATA